MDRRELKRQLNLKHAAVSGKQRRIENLLSKQDLINSEIRKLNEELQVDRLEIADLEQRLFQPPSKVPVRLEAVNN